jgi:hypothetical protein
MTRGESRDQTPTSPTTCMVAVLRTRVLQSHRTSVRRRPHQRAVTSSSNQFLALPLSYRVDAPLDRHSSDEFPAQGVGDGRSDGRDLPPRARGPSRIAGSRIGRRSRRPRACMQSSAQGVLTRGRRRQELSRRGPEVRVGDVNRRLVTVTRAVPAGRRSTRTPAGGRRLTVTPRRPSERAAAAAGGLDAASESPDGPAGCRLGAAGPGAESITIPVTWDWEPGPGPGPRLASPCGSYRPGLGRLKLCPGHHDSDSHGHGAELKVNVPLPHRRDTSPHAHAHRGTHNSRTRSASAHERALVIFSIQAQ